MSDWRMNNHQQFDVISCKLCNNIYNDPRLLDCLHSFCRLCLQSYAVVNIANFETTTGAAAKEIPTSQTNVPSEKASMLEDSALPNTTVTSEHSSEHDTTLEDKAISDNRVKSENINTSENTVKDKGPSAGTSTSMTVLTCPLCQEDTTLDPQHGIEGLLKNVLLQRFIIQAQRDKTMIVAEREVLHMEEQALTEEELRDENVQECIKNIAETAGTVIADAVEDQSRVHDFETVKFRQSLQQTMTGLQEKALDIVYSIDQVNLGIEEWSAGRVRTSSLIKHRSMELQAIIKAIERQLLAKVENRDLENEMKTKAFQVKGQLHRTLKGTLNTVDFFKLLIEFGDKDDLTFYQKVAEERAGNLLKSGANIEETSFIFCPPKTDSEDNMELMFGSLTEVTQQTTVWDPMKSVRKSEFFEDLSPSPSSDVESHHTLTTDSDIQYSEENEHSHDVNMNEKPTYQPQKPGRRPMRSATFHTSSSRSQCDPVTKYRNNIRQSNSQDFQTDSDTGSEEGSEAGNKSNMSSAIQSLAPDNDYTKYPVNISRTRRVSAPPSTIINTLARRRLNALSILERSNIATDHYNTTSNDVELGLNQARLEWIRDNVRKKMNGWRKTSTEVDVEKA